MATSEGAHVSHKGVKARLKGHRGRGCPGRAGRVRAFRDPHRATRACAVARAVGRVARLMGFADRRAARRVYFSVFCS